MSKKIKKLVGYRKMLCLRQSDMAKVIGTSTNSYANKELGRTEFTQSEMEKIFKLLNSAMSVTFEDIFFNS